MMKVNAALTLALMLTTPVTFAAGDHAHTHVEGHEGHGTMSGHHEMSAHHDMSGHGVMASAVGMPAPANQATQTYNVILTDDMKMQFEPSLSIKQGDVVRFVVANKGQIPHEFSIGSIDEQAKHREMMRAMPDMEHHDGTTVTLAAGETAEMGWHFMGQNFVEFSCNIPGHSEAGMKRNTILK
ncbi:cupredoxin family protein [Photobacterium rosenbergii]|uniref:cupredoxin family protein n=1 Tax=Photobacterium rosenbergii TaxID=294936 RepID=UPI0021BDDDEF|nr:cupredoxin family protein [Photobacterium rosenbergii]